VARKLALVMFHMWKSGASLDLAPTWQVPPDEGAGRTPHRFLGFSPWRSWLSQACRSKPTDHEF